MTIRRQVGVISQTVIDLLGLSCPCDTPIFIGPTNVQHMESRHADDYTKYSCHLDLIISSPDYVGLNGGDGSIEFVKEFSLDATTYVKVAVRISQSGQYFARSIYTLNTNRVNNFIKKGTLKKV